MEKLSELTLLEKFFIFDREVFRIEKLVRLPVNKANILMGENLKNNKKLLDELKFSLQRIKLFPITELNKSRLIWMFESYLSQLDALLNNGLSANFCSQPHQSIYNELRVALRYIISTTHGGFHNPMIKSSTDNFDNTRNLRIQINEMLLDMNTFFPSNYFQLISKTEEFIGRLNHFNKLV